MADYLGEALVKFLMTVGMVIVIGGLVFLLKGGWGSYRSLQRTDPEQVAVRPTFKRWLIAVVVAMLVAWAIFLGLLERGTFL